MANVEIATMPFPFSLGKIIPGATFATVSVPLTQNYTPTQHGSPWRMFNGIFIFAWGGSAATAGNAGNIYVCNSADAPDLVNFTNVVAVLPAGYTFPRSKDWSQNRDLGVLYIGAENDTDFAVVSIDNF